MTDLDANIDMFERLTACGCLEDAALKIESLERALVKLREDRPFITGWNEGWSDAVERAASIAEDVKTSCLNIQSSNPAEYERGATIEKIRARARGAGYAAKRIRTEMKTAL